MFIIIDLVQTFPSKILCKEQRLIILKAGSSNTKMLDESDRLARTLYHDHTPRIIVSLVSGFRNFLQFSDRQRSCRHRPPPRPPSPLKPFPPLHQISLKSPVWSMQCSLLDYKSGKWKTKCFCVASLSKNWFVEHRLESSPGDNMDTSLWWKKTIHFLSQWMKPFFMVIVLLVERNDGNDGFISIFQNEIGDFSFLLLNFGTQYCLGGCSVLH